MKKINHTQLEQVRLDRRMNTIAHNQPNIPKFRISRLKYLLHTILSHKQDDHPGAYSVLKMEYLRKVVPSAHLYMKYLRDLGIIEWKNYSKGRNSRLYRLCNEGHTEERPVTDPELIRRIEATYKEIRRHNSTKYPYLNDTIRKAKIDIRAAKADIEADYRIHGCEARRNHFLATVGRFHSGNRYMTVSKTNGRYNSNLTQLPSFLMKHVTVDGKPLRELDLKNSQPFIAAALLNPTPEIEKFLIKFTNETYTMRIKSAKLNERKDVRLFTSLVCSGELYDFLEEKFRAKGLRFRDRGHLKERVFKIIYSPTAKIRRRSETKIFRELFPTIYGMFYFVKHREHNTLANLLTSIESHLVVDLVVPAIREKYPDFVLITKHDAIYAMDPKFFTAGDYKLEDVRDIFERTIENITGLRPTVKISGKRSYNPVRTTPLREGTNPNREPHPLKSNITANYKGSVHIMESLAHPCKGKAINGTVVHAVITGRIKGSTCVQNRGRPIRPVQRKNIPEVLT